MGAISYRHVLKKVYNCDPEDVFGSDEGVYIKMEDAYTALKAKLIYEQHDSAYKENFTVVRSNVFSALKELITLHTHKLTAADKHLVERYLEQLHPDFYDKEILDNILNSVGEMLSKYNGD